MPRCFEVDLIDVVLGTILGRLILGAIEGLWAGIRERHNDGGGHRTPTAEEEASWESGYRLIGQPYPAQHDGSPTLQDLGDGAVGETGGLGDGAK